MAAASTSPARHARGARPSAGPADDRPIFFTRHCRPNGCGKRGRGLRKPSIKELLNQNRRTIIIARLSALARAADRFLRTQPDRRDNAQSLANFQHPQLS